LDDSQLTAARIREGIAALRTGDRARAHGIFQELTTTAPASEHAWIGLALSSAGPAEAAAALHQAEAFNPNSRFVSQAETDLTARMPGFADALAAERGTLDLGADPGALLPTDANIAAATAEVPIRPATRPLDEDVIATAPIPVAGAVAPPPDESIIGSGARLGTGGAAATPQEARNQRMMLNALLGLGSLAAIILLGFAIWNTVNRPPPPAATATPVPPTQVVATRTPAPTATEVVAQATATNPGAATATGVATETVVAIVPTNTVVQGTLGPVNSPTPDPDRQAALAAVQAGRYAEAIPALELASERNPGDPELLYYLAISYLSAPDRPHGAEDATLTLRSLQAAQPHWAPGLDLLARALIAQGQYREAVTPAHQAVEADPTRAEYWMTLGRAYEGAGAKEEADKAYAEAVRHNPTPGPATPAVSGTGTPGLPGTPGLTATATISGGLTLPTAGPGGTPSTGPATPTLGLGPIGTTAPAAPVTATLTLPAVTTLPTGAAIPGDTPVPPPPPPGNAPATLTPVPPPLP
jgi:Flp pilus assembly protein TadD